MKRDILPDAGVGAASGKPKPLEKLPSNLSEKTSHSVMKLHLPSGLRKALLACLAAIAAPLSTTLASATLDSKAIDELERSTPVVKEDAGGG